MGNFVMGSRIWPGLAKLLEECGEVTQVCGKAIQMGGELEHYDGSNIEERFIEELGDLQAAIDFFVMKNNLSLNAIKARAAGKMMNFLEWHIEQLEE